MQENLTKYQCLCSQCGDVRTFGELVRQRNRNSVCKPCSDKNRVKPKDRFTRECDTCHEVKVSNYHIKSTTCVKCAQKKVGARLWLHRDSDSKTTYTYFCHYCTSVRVMNSKRKSNNCSDCARIHNKRNRREPSIYFDFEEMKMRTPKLRHFAYCDTCDDHREVQSKRMSGNVKCIKHKHLDEDTKASQAKRVATREANGTKIGRKKNDGTRPRQLKRTTQVSPEAIERARELNREHKQAQANKPKQVVQKRTEEEMMEDYLKTHEVKVYGSTEPINQVHFISGSGIVGTSVMS